MAETADTPLNFDADATARISRYVEDIRNAAGTVGEMVVAGCLAKGLAGNALAVAEYALRDLAVELSVNLDTVARVADRHAELRAANGRIHALERALGDAANAETMQAGLKALDRQLNAWWDLEGFGYISELAFGACGAKVNFSCHLFGDFSLTRSQTPVSDVSRKAAWHAELQARGFTLIKVPGEHDPLLVDAPSTRAALVALFAERLPSAKVLSFETVSTHGLDASDPAGFHLRGVEVFIRELADIRLLPQPDAKPVAGPKP